MYMALNHEVAPKEAALGCSDCHTEDSRIDFVALGYEGDPVNAGPRFAAEEEPEVPADIVEEEPAGTPGFEAALALVGLLGAVLLARRD
jgi:PGF-CTERM protein